MRKTSFEYHIHGYRYAPESFHIYKGLPGQEKTELPLSDEQRYQMGYLYLTQGIKSAVDYVKHIERERERNRMDCRKGSMPMLDGCLAAMKGLLSSTTGIQISGRRLKKNSYHPHHRQ